MTNETTWFAANRAMWDERAPIHAAGPFYDLEGFKSGRDSIRPYETPEVGDVSGKSLLHLQCHIGLDTLSWARRGAAVTGLDFSAPALVVARELAADMGMTAEFVEANVYDAVEALSGRQFDVVYTGIGAICWLPDIRRWAHVAAALVKSGGFFYITETHPFASMLGDDNLTATYDYFRGIDRPFEWNDAGSYATAEATQHNQSFEWPHPLGAVVMALIEAGLRLELLHEHDFVVWKRWPFLEKSDFDTYRLPDGMPRLPLMYSIRASKPL